MILGKISNLKDHSFMTAEMLEFLKKGDFKPGTEHEFLTGGKVLVQGYTTKPAADKRLEAHRKFRDVQCVLVGEEIMWYSDIIGLELDEEKNLASLGRSDYSPERDIVFFKDPEPAAMIPVKVYAGYFAYFEETDAHKPCCDLYTYGPSDVLKLVFKIPVEN